MEKKRLYLKPGDPVRHLTQRRWGIGVVIECATSRLAGGTALVRILFTDGKLRIFGNDLGNQNCCYYFGIRHCDPPSLGFFSPARVSPVAIAEAIQRLRALGPHNGHLNDPDGASERRALDVRRVRAFAGPRPPDIRDLNVIEIGPQAQGRNGSGRSRRRSPGARPRRAARADGRKRTA